VKTFVRIKKYKLVALLVADSNVSLLGLVFVTKPKKKKVVIDVFTSGPWTCCLLSKILRIMPCVLIVSFIIFDKVGTKLEQDSFNSHEDLNLFFFAL